MRGRIFVIGVIFCLSIGSISALPPLPPLPRIFPNISSLPPLLPNGTKPAWEAFRNFSGCRAGDKVDGLSKLKKYFQDFGYINNNSSSNFTDDFDDNLEKAVKTYQRNFNLNETGQLDDDTLKQIERPRCGNADIINGTSSMNSGKPSSQSNNSGSYHAVAHYSFFEDMPRWPESNRDLTYAFLPDNELNETAKAVFRRAFARWSEVTTLTFTETESYYLSDIKIAFYSGDHGDGEAFDGVLGTLAHAFSPTSGQFHLDNDEYWVVDGDVTKSTLSSAIDMESVAVHEIGHLLGLGHSSVEDAIMYPTISAKTRKVELVQDDIEGIQVLYGSNPNYNGSSTVSSQEKDASGSADTGLVPSLWGLTVLVAVGIVVMV